MKDVFGSTLASAELRVNAHEIEMLKTPGNYTSAEVKAIVHRKMDIVKRRHEQWLDFGKAIACCVEGKDLKAELRMTDTQCHAMEKARGGGSDGGYIGALRQIAEQLRGTLRGTSGELSTRPLLSAGWWSLLDEEENRRKAELRSRLQLTTGYAAYRMAEWECIAETVPPAGDTGDDERKPEDESATDFRDGEPTEDPAANTGSTCDETPIYGVPFADRMKQALNALNKADAAHPNHYYVLQFLALVFAEPRRGGKELGIAEQYAQRAIRANPSDAFGHELLADILYHRIANQGVDITNKELIKQGLREAQQAIVIKETSGSAHLLKARFQSMLIEIERNPDERRRVLVDFNQNLNHAKRFLPMVYQKPDPDLLWLKIVAKIFRLKGLSETADSAPEAMAEFNHLKTGLRRDLDNFVDHCELLRQRWVARQRVFQTNRMKIHAEAVMREVTAANVNSFNDIKIPFL